MTDEKKKRSGILDKVILGAIIGGAVGSVLGLSIAPQKGKDTRKFLKKKGTELHERFIDEYGDDIEKITDTAKTHSRNFFSRIGKRVTGLFEKRKNLIHNSEEKKDTWEIPDEFDT